MQIRRLLGRAKKALRPSRLKRLIVRPPTVTAAEIIRALRELGIAGGDEVMFHSSLSSLGYVEGGAEAVIDAFLEAVGPEGTVMMPSFSVFHVRRGIFGSWWDPRSTPVYTGVVSEAFWRRSGAIRSAHPTHAVAAIGRRAAYFTSGHSLEGDRYGFWGTGVFGSQSPWEKMIREDVHYMMAGCTFEPATLGHHVESYIVTKHLSDLPLTEEKGLATCLLHKYYNPAGIWPRIDRVKLADALKREGLVRRVRVGKAYLEHISAAQYFHRGVEICLREPQAWLSSEYLAWKARVDKRRAEIQQQLQSGKTP